VIKSYITKSLLYFRNSTTLKSFKILFICFVNQTFISIIIILLNTSRVVLTNKKKTQGRNLKCQIFIQHFFKIVLHWCLDLICHNVGTSLKHNKYMFDIPIPFCHNLYLSATFNRICQFWYPLSFCLHVKAARAIWLVVLTNPFFHWPQHI
jgi:hypothetical protein